MVTVEDYTGSSIDNAESDAAALGLEASRTSTDLVPPESYSSVVEQSLAPQEEVEYGSPIVLTYCTD